MARAIGTKTDRWALLGCAALALLAMEGAAQMPEKSSEQSSEQIYAIPAQDLGTALNEFGLQSGREILFSVEEVKGKTAPALSGLHSTQEALGRLLDGTDIEYRINEQETVLVGGVSLRAAGEAGRGAFGEVTERGDPGIVVEEILVTGSRIRQSDTTRVGPMTILRDEDIVNTGITNAEILLQRLPSSAGFAGNSNAAYWVAGGWGTAQVNLRGLGGSRTLVLLNGRRVVSGGSGANDSVDLNMIPLSAIARVEILKDGASAVYGADAVGGVVNFITRERFEGLQIDAKYGATNYGDGEEFSLGLTWGVSSERGDLIFDGRYQDNRAAPLADRAPCALADIRGDNTLRCTPGSSSTAGGRAVLPDGSQINFSGGDAYEPFDIQAHGFNSNPFFNAANPLKRLSISTFGNYELSARTRVFAEALFNWRTSTQPGSPATLRNIAFDSAHPTNPTGQNISVLRRRTAEFGARVFTQEVNTWRFVAGIKGSFGRDLSYDLAVNWGRNNAVDALLNNINTRRLAQALDSAVCGRSGIPCADILGEGDLSSEVGDYILFNQRDSGGNEQKSLSGNISGVAFHLPAGPLGVAAGFEFREDSGWLDPDALLAAGAALGNAQDPIRGSVEVREFYGEAHLPLLSEVPGVEDLNLDLALRFSDYELFGRDTNYKTGVNWQVTPAFKLRGAYASAFRAPSVPELFSGLREAQLPTSDPCSGWASLDPSSVLYGNCQAAGVPRRYVQLGAVVVTDIGGNPALQPEDAKTFTAGVVFEPVRIPGLALTADYFAIDIENAIARTGGSTKLAICYGSPGLSHPFCGAEHHTRNRLTGDIDFLSAQSANTGNEVMSGVDIGAAYDFDIGPVTQQLKLKATYLQRYEISAFEGDTPLIRDGGVGCCVGGYPKWRASGSWTASAGRWSGSYNMQMIGSATDWFGEPGRIGTEIDALFYHSLQGRYRLSDTIELRLGIDNLLDEDAPYVRSWTDGNTDTMTYSLLGRFVYARAVFSFK